MSSTKWNAGWYEKTGFGDDGRGGEGLCAQAAKRPHELCPRIDVRSEVTEHSAFGRNSLLQEMT
jgi:hypothetical protein